MRQYSHDFAHLHVHTEHSFDGFSRIEPLVDRAKELGMRHLAITDHGTMAGVWRFYRACKARDIHPILGVEAYLADDLTDRSKKYDYHHVLLLASSTEGYHNLMNLTTIAHTRGYYYRPRIDFPTLASHAQGLIATSGCLSAEIPRLLLRGDEASAKQAIRRYQEVFGERFYLEIQEHHGKGSQQSEVNQRLYELGKELSLPLVATNDLHYIDQADAPFQDLITCIRMKQIMSNPTRMHMDSTEYYLRSPSEMWSLFGREVPQALSNTITIAEACDSDLAPVHLQLPEYALPPGMTSEREYLLHLCQQGAQARFHEISAEVWQRLRYELEVIGSTGFVRYFLLVYDVVAWMREQGIRCSARGSVAGSLVAYVLGITNVDPLAHALLFERFLHLLRVQMPDIDIDVDADQRERLLAYLSVRFGTANVAQMITFTTLAGRSALKDVARVLGMAQLGERLAALVPVDTSIGKALEMVPAFGHLYETKREARDLVEQARGLEGVIRGPSIHPAGIVITHDPLTSLVPLQLRVTSDPQSGLVSQYDHPALEGLGLLKLDFLGSSNLSILQRTLSLVKETRGIALELEQIPLDDAKTFALFAHGHTTGIFQFEGRQLSGFLKQLRPNCVNDLIVVNALYRPGPIEHIQEFIDRKHGRKKVTYLHPCLKELLEDTYGVLVYQDQVLLTVVNVGGFTWGEADGFRKAISKKIPAHLAAYRDKFLAGCQEHAAIPLDIAERIYEQIEPFAGYGFNKAHAASYALIAYYTAYLKANYTPEFMAATMTTEATDAAKIAKNIAECKRMGVRVLPPDVNASEGAFTIHAGAVRFGLFAVKGFGETPTRKIVQSREEEGPFRDLADFCTRVDLGKSTIELLVKAGAMDGLGKRHQLLDSIERARKFGKQERDRDLQGMQTLFAGPAGIDPALLFHLNPHAPVVAGQQLEEWERELLSVCLSHMQLDVLQPLWLRGVLPIGQIEEVPRKNAVVGGLLTSVQIRTTEQGKEMCQAELEDPTGGIHLTVFPSVYEKTREIWQQEKIVLVSGAVQRYKGTLTLVCHRAKALPPPSEEKGRSQTLRITLRTSGTDQEAVAYDKRRVQALYDCLTSSPGVDSYEIVVRNEIAEILLIPKEPFTTCDPALIRCLEVIVGVGSVEMHEGGGTFTNERSPG